MPPPKSSPALALKKTAKTRTASESAPKTKSARPPNHSSRRIWVVSKYAKQRLSTAEALADQLGLAVNRIDLSKLLSTYIGETEKNLARVFETAEQKDSLLYIDEADALFGRRTSVTDAHDRFANKEVGYFFQRLERFAGPVVIATRRKYLIKPALLRRFRLSVVTPLALPKVRAKRGPSRALAI